MQKFYNKNLSVKGFTKSVKVFAVLFFTTLLSVSAVAQNYTPNTFADPDFTSVNNATGAIILPAGNAGMISLRSSLFAADLLGGAHTVFLSTGTYNLTQAIPNRQKLLVTRYRISLLPETARPIPSLICSMMQTETAFCLLIH